MIIFGFLADTLRRVSAIEKVTSYKNQRHPSDFWICCFIGFFGLPLAPMTVLVEERIR